MKHDVIALTGQTQFQTQKSQKSDTKRKIPHIEVEESSWICQSPRKKVKSESFLSDRQSIDVNLQLNLLNNSIQVKQNAPNFSKTYSSKQKTAKFQKQTHFQQQNQKKPLRTKFQHLCEEMNTICLSQEIRNIIYVQGKLDDHLIFLKNIRNKKFGQNFKQIKKKLWFGSQACLTITILKQILYICPHFYEVAYSHSNDDHPYLIKIPANFQSPEQRKRQFRALLINFLNQKRSGQKTESSQNRVEIPLHEFQVKRISSQKLIEQLDKSKRQLLNKNQRTQIKAMQVLDKSYDFKKKLYALIKEKEIKVKMQSLVQPNREQVIDKKQIEAILQEIYKIYTAKTAQNIFYVSLIQNLQSNVKLFTTKQKIICIVQQIMDKSGGFLKLLKNYSRGQIVQIDKKKYNQAKKIFGLNRQNLKQNTQTNE